jgi:hypothetical protein
VVICTRLELSCGTGAAVSEEEDRRGALYLIEEQAAKMKRTVSDLNRIKELNTFKYELRGLSDTFKYADQLDSIFETTTKHHRTTKYSFTCLATY